MDDFPLLWQSRVMNAQSTVTIQSAQLADYDDLLTARPLSAWSERDGDALWWRFPLTEPPYVGSPLDDDWPGYHTHWTPVPVPRFVVR